METTTMRHLRLAAESGDAAAQFNLGVLFDSREDDNGYAIEGNRTQAIKWLLAAAEQGLPRAQSRLAELYAGGPNASGNLVNACAWFLLATKSSRGIHRHQARSEYERISTRLVKTFSRPLSQQQNPNRVGPIRKPGLDLLEKD